MDYEKIQIKAKNQSIQFKTRMNLFRIRKKQNAFLVATSTLTHVAKNRYMNACYALECNTVNLIYLIFIYFPNQRKKER